MKPTLSRFLTACALSLALSSFHALPAGAEETQAEAPKSEASAAPAAEGDAAAKAEGGDAKAEKKDKKSKKKDAAAAPQSKNPKVLVSTSMGDITFELNEEKAPISVKNFLQYVNDKHYEGTIFHRVIPGFMIQGGGMDKDMKEKSTRAPIKNESSNGLKNDEGTIAMARTPDPDSASAQFFINVKDNGFLNKEQAQDGFGYAVFGKVTKGMDVVHKIEKVETGNSGPHQNVPTKPVVIKKMKVLK